jgi:hypothetical protein
MPSGALLAGVVKQPLCYVLPDCLAAIEADRVCGLDFDDAVTVTELDCTPGMRHGNSCDSAVAVMRYHALFCAKAVSNSRGDR